MLKVMAMSLYLESHAKRAYASGPEAETAAAKVILLHIKRCDLKDGFTARDVLRPHWARLADRDAVQAALALLIDHQWLACQRIESGGRPTTTYTINSRGMQ
jgi:hypothetical protein